MNHYPHHIGDFNNATRHLTRVERSLYRDMLDLYYDTEQPLNRDTNKLARRLLANSEEERVAMQAVLDEFFTLEDDGWHSARCDAEIAKYQGLIEQASRAGKASAAKRSNKTATKENAPSIDAEQDLNDRSTPVAALLNQPEPEPEPEPNRNTKEEKKVEKKESPLAAGAASPPPHFSESPIAKVKPKKPQAIAKPDGVAEAVWLDWLALRRSKKAAVTQTVLAQARVEAGKAGISLNDFFTEWCLRGSQGLKAEWLQNDQARKTGSATGSAPTKQFTVNGVGVSPVTVGNVRSVQEFFRRRGQEFHAEIGERDVLQDAAKSSTVIDI